MKKWEDEIQKKTQSLWENHKVALLISILAIPLIIQIVFGVFNLISEIESWSFKFPDSSNWIGFWGSYLGVIPSGLIAYAVAKFQIENEKDYAKNQKQQQMLPYLTLNHDQECFYTKTGDVFQYQISFFIKLSVDNMSSYPIRDVTVFLYMKSEGSESETLQDSIFVGDIFPNNSDYTYLEFYFQNKENTLRDRHIIIYGRLTDGRIIKISANKHGQSHFYINNKKVWISYEPEPLENSFTESEKAKIFDDI